MKPHDAAARRGLPRLIAPALIATALAGCATTRPNAYADLASARSLRRNEARDAATVPFAFSAERDFRRYTRVILDPVIIYRGRDAQFEKVDEAGRRALADYMQARFADRLETAFELVTAPAPGTLRVRLTLAGARATKKILATLSRLDLGGGAYNAVQGVRGREGAMTGSVIYAVEIYDAPSRRLLSAYVARRYPAALNIGSTFGALGAARKGIDKGADALLAQLSGRGGGDGAGGTD